MNRIMNNPAGPALAATVFWVAPMALPLLAILQMFTPLPLLLAALRGGLRGGLITLALPALFGIGVSGSLGSVIPLLLIGAFPLLAGWLMSGGWRVSHCLFLGAFLGLAVLFVGILLAGLGGLDMEAALMGWLQGPAQAWKAQLESAQGLDAPTRAQALQALDELLEILARILPALAMGGWFLVQAGNLLLVRLHLRQIGSPQPAPEDLTRFRIPFLLVWPLIAMWGLVWLTEGNWRFLGLNLGLFLSLLYLFQGMAVVQTAFDHWKLAAFFRGLFFVALLFWNFLLVLVMLVGLFDAWADFRNRWFNTEGRPPSGESE